MSRIASIPQAMLCPDGFAGPGMRCALSHDPAAGKVYLGRGTVPPSSKFDTSLWRYWQACGTWDPPVPWVAWKICVWLKFRLLVCTAPTEPMPSSASASIAIASSCAAVNCLMAFFLLLVLQLCCLYVMECLSIACQEWKVGWPRHVGARSMRLCTRGGSVKRTTVLRKWTWARVKEEPRVLATSSGILLITAMYHLLSSCTGKIHFTANTFDIRREVLHGCT